MEKGPKRFYTPDPYKQRRSNNGGMRLFAQIVKQRQQHCSQAVNNRTKDRERGEKKYYQHEIIDHRNHPFTTAKCGFASASSTPR
ncbi:hypothetical protein MnTg02_03308 [bacterium MnTg02]|nr:hypothetical protein MnTg02_03308 [bacterium MnTg02]